MTTIGHHSPKKFPKTADDVFGSKITPTKKKPQSAKQMMSVLESFMQMQKGT